MSDLKVLSVQKRAGLGGDGPGGVMALLVEKGDAVAQGGKAADGLGPDAAAAARDDDVHGNPS